MTNKNSLVRLFILNFFSFIGVFFITICFNSTAFAAVSGFEFTTGYYVGNGTSQSISGLGFRPDLVVIKADNAQLAIMKNSAMPVNNTAYFTATADNTAGQITLDNDGFTLGSLSALNSVNTRFTYMAVGESDCSVNGDFCTGIYIGDGTASRKITTGFEPDLIWVKRSGTRANWRSSAMPDNIGQYFDNTVQDALGMLFKNIVSDGFYVGSTNNTTLGVYYYVAFKEVPNKLNIGTYLGDGVDNRIINGIGFKPDYVLLKNADLALDGALNLTESNGDYSGYFRNIANATNLIQALLNDGFEIGSSDNVNGVGSNLYWAAFKNTVTQNSAGTFNMAQGNYTGTGAAFSINELGFKPDLVMIKSEDAQHSVFRTGLMAGDSTAYLGYAAANFADGITSIDADGFSLGLSTTVNTAGQTYHWTAFGNAWRPDKNTGSSDFAIGAYTGNGLDSRNILKLPFSPSLLTIKRFGTTAGTWHSSLATGDYSLFFHAAAGAANVIQSINADGFNVGTSSYVNAIGNVYHWFAFKEGSSFKLGSYIGTGSAGDINTVGFKPNLVWIKSSTTAIRGALRSTTQTGDSTLPFIDSGVFANAITSLINNGFSLGTNTEVNSNSVVYYYGAWRNPDTTPPTAGITYSPASGTFKNGDVLTITANFNEPMAGSPVVQIEIDGANTLGASNMTKVNNTTYTFSHNVGTGSGLSNVKLVTGTDKAGNQVVMTPTSGATFTADNTRPSVVLSSTQTSPTNAVLINMTATFNEDVIGFSDGDIIITNGAISNFSGSGSVYTFDIIPNANTTVTADINADVSFDSAGNGNDAATQYTIVSDQVPPTSQPIAAPGSGTYSPSVSVSLSSTDGDFIRYIFNGADPTCTNGYLFGANISFSSSGVLKTIACDNANNGTAVSVFNYTITQSSSDNGGGGGGGGTRTLKTISETENDSLIFTDINDHWGKEYIEKLSKNCSVEGYRDENGNFLHKFGPNNPITRAELVKIMLGCENQEISDIEKSSFADVKTSDWYAKYIEFAKSKKIISGYEGNVFKPNNNVNRVESLKIILLPAFDESQINEAETLNPVFKDASPEAWYKKYLNFAFIKGFVSGYKDKNGNLTGIFGTGDFMTRAEAAKVISLAKGF